jgi:hypothetical protein
MQRRISWLLVPLCWALACGGRFVQTPGGDDDDDTSTGQGGSVPSQAGSVGRSGATSVGGKATGIGGKASGGPVGTSGSTAVGGAPTCACDPILCPSGYQTVPDANGCCYHCELDLKACALQRQAYLEFRQQLLSKYSYGCMVASDCATYYDKNSCGATSCGIAVATANYKNLVSNLDSYAQMACSPACPPAPEPPCDPSPPECYKGYCE